MKPELPSVNMVEMATRTPTEKLRYPNNGPNKCMAVGGSPYHQTTQVHYVNINVKMT